MQDFEGEATMLSVRTLSIGFAAAAVCLGSVADAGSLQVHNLRLSCENGRTYLIRPHGVSIAGELVTGYLHTSPRRAIYIRLIPMSDGYRYAGRGIWLDGKRENAELQLGQYHSVPCTVSTI